MNQQNLWKSMGLIIALLLSVLSPLETTLAATTYSISAQGTGNEVALGTVTTAAGTSGVFSLALDNSDAVASGQFRFTYATALGLAITGVQVTNRTTGFVSTGSAYATGNASLLGYQVLFYNLSNLTIEPGTGAILTFAYTTTANGSGNTALSFAQAILASAAAQPLAVTTVDGSFTISVPLTATSTHTPVPPTATSTNTPVPPTATSTNTPVPPTATSTHTPVPPTATSTHTPVPPTAISTNTPVPPTATSTKTPAPPTATSTNTPVLPTATLTKTPTPPRATRTKTPVPSTATFTKTPIPPTATSTLSATALPTPAHAKITIIEDAQPNSIQNFTYFGTFGSFLLDDAVPDDNDGVGNTIRYSVGTGVFNFNEVVPTSWYLAAVNCTPSNKATINLIQNSVSITTLPDDQITCTFVNQRRVNLTAILFNDLNLNHIMESNEPKLANWAVRFYSENNLLIQQLLTNSHGEVALTNRPPGTFRVCEVPQAGWRNTLPVSVNSSLNLPCHTANLPPGQDGIFYFGNSQQTVAINEAIPAMAAVVVTSQKDFEDFTIGKPEEETRTLSIYLPLVAR